MGKVTGYATAKALPSGDLGEHVAIATSSPMARDVASRLTGAQRDAAAIGAATLVCRRDCHPGELCLLPTSRNRAFASVRGAADCGQSGSRRWSGNHWKMFHLDEGGGQGPGDREDTMTAALIGSAFLLGAILVGLAVGPKWWHWGSFIILTIVLFIPLAMAFFIPLPMVIVLNVILSHRAWLNKHSVPPTKGVVAIR